MASSIPASDPAAGHTENHLTSTNSSTPYGDATALSDRPVAPDQFEPRWETDKWEIWSYYLYYVGNNGLTLFNFAPTAFQNLLYEAAGDGTSLKFAGRYVSIDKTVMI